MKMLKLIRYSEWWETKLPPLLAIGYAGALQAGKNIYETALWLGFLLLSIIVGAVYVSIINDITDIKDDAACGKSNGMSAFTPLQRAGWLVLSLLPGAACAYFLGGRVWLYLASYAAFTLYSVPPFRFKKRGFAGVLCDACGAHLFPSLLMAVGTGNYFFAAVGIWSLMYGLRGILWHQFMDRKNDLATGIKTFATGKNPGTFNTLPAVIMSLELAALAAMLVLTGSIWPVMALLVYLLLVLYYHRAGMKLIAIVTPEHRPWHIVLSSYYQAYLPIALLFANALVYPTAWIILGIHLLLFPRYVIKIFSAARMFSAQLLRS